MDRITRVVRMDKKQIAALFKTHDHQHDVMLALYRLAFPDWDYISTIDGWPSVSPATGKAIALLWQTFDQKHHPDVLPGGFWMNKGFSTHGAEELDDWIILVNCDVEYIDSEEPREEETHGD